MPLISARGLGKDYGSFTAVHGLDLDVGETELLGFLGPNGAGKTTAISMLCGVVTPTRGSASIAGFDLRKDALRARSQMGLSPQEIALYEPLTARENLSYFGRVYGLRGSALKEAVAWALSVADLSARADEQVERFSGG